MVNPIEKPDTSTNGEKQQPLLLHQRVMQNLEAFVTSIERSGLKPENYGYTLVIDENTGIEFMRKIQYATEEATKSVLVIFPGTLQHPQFYLPHAKAFEEDFDVVVINPATLHRSRAAWEDNLEQGLQSVLANSDLVGRPLTVWGESAGGASAIKLDESQTSFTINNMVLSRTAPPHSSAWRKPITMATGVLSWMSQVLPVDRVIRIARGKHDSARYSWKGINGALEQLESSNWTNTDKAIRDRYFVPLSHQNLPTQTSQEVAGHMISARNATRRRRGVNEISQTPACIMYSPGNDHIIDSRDIISLERKFPNNVLIPIPSVYGHNGFFTSVGRQILAAAQFFEAV